MRPFCPADLTAAARLLWCTPFEDRNPCLFRLFSCADAADRYRKRLGKCHALWGDGSIAGYIGMNFDLPAEPPLSARGYLEAKLAVLHGFLEWRDTQKRMA